jgi:hypothetical protein
MTITPDSTEADRPTAFDEASTSTPFELPAACRESAAHVLRVLGVTERSTSDEVTTPKRTFGAIVLASRR